MIYTILGIYLAVTIAVGFFAWRRTDSTAEGYFLAGRSIGTVTTFFTLIATNFSAFFFLGFAGASYRIGYSYYGIMAVGTALVAPVFLTLGVRAWQLGRRHGFITPPELVRELSGSPALSYLYLAVMVFFTIPYLAIQPIGAGYLLNELTGGAIPYFAGAMLLTAFMVLYVFMGGMRGVALTDVVQGVMMLGLTVAAVLFIAHELGGITQANEMVMASHPAVFSREGVGGYFTPARWFSFMILFVLAVPMFPQVFMRFFIPRSAQSLRTTAVLYPVVTALLFLGPVMIGVFGRVLIPGIEGTDSDQILPMLLSEFAPAWLGGLVMVGALAAFMSTMDSQLLALSGMITRDVWLRFAGREVSVEQQSRLGRFFVVALAAAGLIIAIRPPGPIFDIATAAFTGLAVLFPTTVAVMYMERPPVGGCIVSIVVGELTLVGFQYGVLPERLMMGFLPLVPVMVVTVACLAAGAMLQRLRPI